MVVLHYVSHVPTSYQLAGWQKSSIGTDISCPLANGTVHIFPQIVINQYQLLIHVLKKKIHLQFTMSFV